MLAQYKSHAHAYAYVLWPCTKIKDESSNSEFRPVVQLVLHSIKDKSSSPSSGQICMK